MRFSILLTIFLFGIVKFSHAQNPDDYISLVSVFNLLQEKYQVDFSYSNDEVDPISIQKIDISESLATSIERLELFSPFEFKLLPNQIFAVMLKSSYKYYCITPINFETQSELNQVDFYVAQYKIFTRFESEVVMPISNKKPFTILAKTENLDHQRFDLNSLETGNCFKLYFYPKPINLDEVVITNYITKGINKLKSGQIRFNPSYFGSLPGLIEPDVLQSIQTLPGVMSTEESVSYLNVRGGTHDQNLFLWDGIKMYQTSHFFGMITALNPYMTQSTDIIKNGSNPEFGDGVSSVINMKTNKEINHNLKAEVGVNMVNADFFLDAPIQDNSSLQISGRQSINQIAKTPTYNQFFDKVFQNTAIISPSNGNEIQQTDNFSFYDFSFRWLYQLTEKDFLRVNGLLANNEFLLNREEFDVDLINSRESSLAQQNQAFGVFYERKWNTGFISSLQFYTSNYTLRAVNTDLIQAQTLTQENKVEEWGLKFKNSYHVNSEFFLNFGYQLNETGILNFENISAPFFRRSIQEAIFTNSLFIGLNYQPTPKTFIGFGSRMNHISKFNSLLFEPRLSLSHQFLNGFVFELQAGQKSQTTSQIIDQQSDFLGVESRRWVLANPDEIPVITSEQLSLGLSYQKNKWLITTDLYYKRVLDITTQSQGFQNQFQFETTTGNYEVLGAEFLINKSWKRFSSWLSYTLTDNSYYFEELVPQEFSNNLDITHVVDFGINYNYKGLNVSSGLHWHSGVPTTAINSSENAEENSLSFGFPNQENLRNFFRVDFSANYKFAVSNRIKLYTGVSIWNLLGRNNVYRSFFNNPNHSMMSQTFQQGLGFTPNFSLRLQF